MKEIRKVVQDILQPLKFDRLKVCGNCDETFTVSMLACPGCARILNWEAHSLLWSHGDWRVFEMKGEEYAVQYMPPQDDKELGLRGSEGTWWFFPTATKAFGFVSEARKEIEHGK